MTRISWMAATALLAAGCASPGAMTPDVDADALASEKTFQQTLVLDRRVDEEKRLAQVSAKILAANVAYCDVKGPWLGLALPAINDYPRMLRPIAKAHYALGEDALMVLWVAEGSPAAAAGLAPGDRIAAVNGATLRPNARGSGEAAFEIDEAAGRGPIHLAVERAGAPLDIAIAPAIVCGYRVHLSWSDRANAYADGRRIVFERGMFKQVASDAELALVIAHELAHNVYGHVDAKRRNAMVGGAGGLLLDLALAAAGVNTQGAFTDAGMDIGALAYSIEFEQEADYVGMYFLARAGFALAGVETFWRRLGAEDPRAVTAASTHPTSAERFLKLKAAAEEIAIKQAAGEPLEPNWDPEKAKKRRAKAADEDAG